MRQRMLASVVLAAMALLWPGGAPLGAMDDVKAKIDNERVSLDLKETSLITVFEVYQKLLGVEVRIRCDMERRVTIVFENITVRSSLNAICESAGLRWSLEASEPPVLRIDCESQPPASPGQPLRLVAAEGRPGAGADWVMAGLSRRLII